MLDMASQLGHVTQPCCGQQFMQQRRLDTTYAQPPTQVVGQRIAPSRLQQGRLHISQGAPGQQVEIQHRRLPGEQGIA